MEGSFSTPLDWHEPYLQRARQLARLGTARVFPNPYVGAVIVARSRIIGEGYHALAGGPHAEVNAVAAVQAADRPLLSEASIFVTLEPCSHHGKTPPCADLILREGIPQVVVGMVDPNPQVAGRGLRRLQGQGHEVLVAADPTPYQQLNPVFLTNQTQQRPFVSLKWAESPDGFVAAGSPEAPRQVQISGREARVHVHRLRAQRQAIVVGRRTAQTDDPSLTTRFFPGEHPLRIVLDRELRLPARLRLFNDGLPTLLLNAHRHGQEGAVRYYVPRQWEDLKGLFAELYQHLGITSLLVEGGAHLLQQCLDQGAFDEVHRLIGPRPLHEGLPGPRLPQGLRWQPPQRMGDTQWLFNS